MEGVTHAYLDYAALALRRYAFDAHDFFNVESVAVWDISRSVCAQYCYVLRLVLNDSVCFQGRRSLDKGAIDLEFSVDHSLL